MEYVYAALLLHNAEKEINEANVKAVLEGAGVEADESRIKALVAALDGVDIEEAVSKAAAAPAAAPAAAAPAAAAPAEAEEEEEEEESEEEAEEGGMAGLGALFG
ncbi:MAG: 50S ribosomal protein P1 [Methanomicrobiales archaeon]